MFVSIRKVLSLRKKFPSKRVIYFQAGFGREQFGRELTAERPLGGCPTTHRMPAFVILSPSASSG
jgi:hypothetical protein